MNDQIKVTVLGWWGAFPKAGQATCGVLIQTPQGQLLLDCGSAVLSKFFEVSTVEQLSGVLLSHLHYDHMGDLGCLQYNTNFATRIGVMSGKLPVYSPKTPTDMWSAIQYPTTTTTPLEDGMRINLAGLEIEVKKVDHTVECYAFAMMGWGRKIVYLTDTTARADFADWVAGADLLICEATISHNTRHSTGLGHMSDIEAATIARDGGVKQLCLYHLPGDGDIPLMRQRAGEVFEGDLVTPDINNVFEFCIK